MNAYTEPLPQRAGMPEWTDPEGLRHAAVISVRVRWFVLGAVLILLAYRPDFADAYILFISCYLVAITLNGYVHYRLRTGIGVTWHWLFALSTTEIALTIAAIAVDGGFEAFFFVLCYPALGMFAVVCTSSRISFLWVTVVAAGYAAVSLTFGEGLEFDAKEEKALFVRIAAMYGVVVVVNLISRFERIRRTMAVQRERELHKERIELSQTIHDTVAQSAYMIGLGIESAIAAAGPANEEQVARLKATHALSRASMWDLRHPIDSGLIFDGRELGEVLGAHAGAFTAITSVPADVVQSGREPPLPAVTRGLLFSIAHNAMTNAMRHASATTVTITLDFGWESVRMSISDDGVGLPSDYAQRGHGFRNMRRDAERVGGKLEARSDGPGNGTTLTCVAPYDTYLGETHRGGW